VDSQCTSCLLSCSRRAFKVLRLYIFVLVTGAGELQQRENSFAVSSQDHGEPHRSGLKPREHVRGYINNSAADASNRPPQEQQCSVSTPGTTVGVGD